MTELIKNKPKIVNIPIEQLRSAPWNYKTTGTKKQLEKLAKSIEASKSAGVLCVRHLEEKANGKQLFEVIDGNHRLEAVRAAGWDVVPCEDFGEISQAQAVVISRQRNYQWFEDDVVKLGKLFEDDVLEVFAKDDLLDFIPDELEDFDKLIAAGRVGPPPLPGEEPPNENSVKPTIIKLSGDQYVVVMQAVSKVREDEEDADIPEGRALELICADFLAQ